MTKEQIYEDALKNIIFKCHRRKMYKNPPPPEEYWEPVMHNPIEVVWLLETVGDIAEDALKEKE